MSTFGGNIDEIPQVSIDNFEGKNETSTVYFLSHCHWDHMKGLSNKSFQNALIQRTDVYLYASPISVKILTNMYKDKLKYPPIEEKLKQLPIDSSTLIKIPGTNKYFTVTTMPAGHCPGSVMFLFEINNKNILYTGDYRVSADDLEKYQAFYSLGKLKRIDKMYLDTTFFDTSYCKLPTRDQSLNKICHYIQNWLEQNPKHLINITPTAKYGSEFLFIEISKRMQMRIHVDQDCYNVYECIPEMDTVITLNAHETRIHSNCGIEFKQMCLPKTDLVCEIKPSTIWWRNKNIDENFVDVDGNQIRVCYSSHASFEEIKEFLLLLKPADVEPCVVPENAWRKQILLKLLKQVMLTYKEHHPKNKSIKLFKHVEGNELQINVDEEEDDLLKALHSPTHNFDRKRKWIGDDNKPGLKK